MNYKPFSSDVLFLGGVTFRRGAANGYVWTSDANGSGSWQAAGGGGATWGSITGTLSSQTDLQTALDLKQNESIVINSNITAVLDGVYTVVASATFTDPTPAEGKGFMVFVRNGTATVGGTGYSTAGTIINRIYHSGAWANYVSGSATLAIGTTPITGGTVGRVLFEGSGNVLQQAANVFWDNTNSRLSLAVGSSPAARLDVLSSGTATTDLTLRLRNSANSANHFLAMGSTQFIFGGATTTPSGMMLLRHNFGAAADNLTVQNGEFGNVLFRVRDEKTASSASIGSIYFGGRVYNQNTPTTQQLDMGGYGLGATYGDNARNIVLLNNAGNVGDGDGTVVISTSSNFYINTQTTKKYKFEANKGNFGIGQMTFGTNGTNVLAMATGVAPTTSPADCFQQYSADIVAGNAAPHFRTENGDIVKIYSIGGWGTPTGTLTRTTFATYAGATAGVLYDQTIMQNLIDAAKITSERLAALISDLKTGQQLLKA
jgi:hypothetical protein